MSHHESAARGPEGRMVDRMLFFTDAVFAIVLTLLAIELHPPHFDASDPDGPWLALAEMAPKFFAFVISFALIGLWWSVHMRLTRRLIAFDWPTAICNLVALMFITLLPFASALFGENISSVEALQVYWIISAGAAISMMAFFLTIARDNGRLIGGIERREWWARIVTAAGPCVAFVLGAYFAHTGHVWLSRWAALYMVPFLMLGPLIYRAPKRSA